MVYKTVHIIGVVKEEGGEQVITRVYGDMDRQAAVSLFFADADAISPDGYPVSIVEVLLDGVPEQAGVMRTAIDCGLLPYVGMILIPDVGTKNGPKGAVMEMRGYAATLHIAREQCVARLARAKMEKEYPDSSELLYVHQYDANGDHKTTNIQLSLPLESSVLSVLDRVLAGLATGLVPDTWKRMDGAALV